MLVAQLGSAPAECLFPTLVSHRVAPILATLAVREQALSCLNLRVLYEQIEFTKERKGKVYTECLYRDEKILCNPHCLVVNEVSAKYLSSLGFPYKPITPAVQLFSSPASCFLFSP